jgi:hypothetical protein
MNKFLSNGLPIVGQQPEPQIVAETIFFEKDSPLILPDGTIVTQAPKSGLNAVCAVVTVILRGREIQVGVPYHKIHCIIKDEDLDEYKAQEDGIALIND